MLEESCSDVSHCSNAEFQEASLFLMHCRGCECIDFQEWANSISYSDIYSNFALEIG